MFQSIRRVLKLALLFAVMSLTAFIIPFHAGAQNEQMSAVDFRSNMRQLWEDHIVWTRMYIVSVAGDLPDQELVVERLLKNQDDIGDAVEPFYGAEAADQLSNLLRDHILRAADLLAAAEAGDTAAVEVANQLWYENADEISAFLNVANPEHWPLEDLTHEMHMHLDLTLKEAVARLEGDYTADIAAYDEVHQHILHMADILSQGIIAQFPDQFNA